MSNLKPGVVDQMALACVDPAACISNGAGHSLSAIRARAAAATSRGWHDGLVAAVSADGWISIEAIDSSDVFVLWQHSDLRAELAIGEPVAFHGIYNVLAIGPTRRSVSPLVAV